MPIGKLARFLLPHEQALLAAGSLEDHTHAGASSAVLHAPSGTLAEGDTLVYRPVGDVEASYLREHGILPDTQPYQAIIEGEGGRAYAEKFISGSKKSDAHPTTVVEFAAPASLITSLFETHSKIEDGAISTGLGSKAGKGLPRFNAALADGSARWRIVTVRAGPRNRPNGGASVQTLVPTRDLSSQYGAGASAYDEPALQAWKAQWDGAAALAKARRWQEVVAILEECASARPDFAKGYLPLSRAHRQLGDPDAARAVLHRGLAACAARGSAGPILSELRKLEAAAEAIDVAAIEADAGVQQAAEAAAAIEAPVAVERQSSLPSAAEASLLAAGFVREGWAWHHEATGTRVIEAADDGAPEVYNSALRQADLDERSALAFAASAWDGFAQRLVRWITDAIVQDGAAGTAADDEGEAPPDPDAIDVGLSRLPTPEELGATTDRALTIWTWGDKVVNQAALEQETGCTRHFNAKPLNGRGGGANLKYNATQDPRVVRNVCSSMLGAEGREWLRRVVAAIERTDEHRISVYCSQGRHRSVSAALILQSRYYPKAEFVPLKMR